MSRSTHRFLIVVIFLLLVLGGYLVTHYVFSSNDVPIGFSNARLQGALIAQDIVNLSNQSTDDLQKVNQLDKESNFTDALLVTASMIERSKEIRARAVELSAELQTMTRALSGIQSPDARQAALEAISDRLTLIGNLINYSNYLDQLLGALKMRFEGGPGNNEDVSALIQRINAEVTAINSFNAQAGQAMDRFDAIMKK